MMAINLYLNYLSNCVLGMSKSDKLMKLNYERKKIIEIINALDSMFEDDPTISDMDNHTIYVIIKRNIVREISARDNVEITICSCKTELMKVIENIDSRVDDLIA